MTSTPGAEPASGSGAAAPGHDRVRRRRQVDAHRPPPARHQAALRRPARGRGHGQSPTRASTAWTSPSSPTACGPSASRASPSTSPTATRRRRSRKFVIADCPGHVQYTRNMATGASTADLAVVVVDATAGTARADPAPHLHRRAPGRAPPRGGGQQDGPGRLGPRRPTGPSTTRSRPWPGAWASTAVTVVPVSALLGDNVVEASTHMPWYDGPTLLSALEEAPAGTWAHDGDGGARLPVQWVVRHPGGGRSYAGMVSGGTFRPGDEVVVLPGGQRSRITSVETFDGPLDEAPASLSVTVRLDDDLDVSRGDLIAPADESPRGGARVRRHGVLVRRCTRRSRAGASGSSTRPGSPRPRSCPWTPAWTSASLELEPAGPARAQRHRRGAARGRHAPGRRPLPANRVTGSFVVIDEQTNATVAAGMVGVPVLAPLAPG